MTDKQIVRKSVALTAAQAEALEQLIAHAEQIAGEATGFDVKVGLREFFHMLLQKHADEIGIAWPNDYPAHGGKRS